jgi:hypothetical protein
LEGARHGWHWTHEGSGTAQAGNFGNLLDAFLRPSMPGLCLPSRLDRAKAVHSLFFLTFFFPKLPADPGSVSARPITAAYNFSETGHQNCASRVGVLAWGCPCAVCWLAGVLDGRSFLCMCPAKPSSLPSPYLSRLTLCGRAQRTLFTGVRPSYLTSPTASRTREHV